ncbi:hydroxyethylthiazole kinase [Tepidibacillus fermentans]|uniref:Hydroxyethylthiazole kinase n=1 Tax=Tepidibacillus fermentans TaxID=1281767 RepID=A0A4V2URW9_9BACI|nr:hydroxyethylthiazole kinase [Tepidibacillus fermentans]TCS79202.1 hydroxyethylthiazole kinase [Tepidibacillus fermentans]
MELEQIKQAIKKVREKKPLIHHLTNLVVTNFTANGTIAYGTSPIMANAPEEVEEMVSVSNGLVINIGTITSEMVEAMILAGKKANQVGVPIILDPVGVGATSYRTNTIFNMLEQFKPTVIRGNTSEMARLAEIPWEIKGVDSVDNGEGDRLAIATKVAKKYHVVAAVTGKEDIVTDGERIALIANGHPLLSEVTGTGCLVTALIGATIAAEEDHFIATVAALTYYGIAAERAAIHAKGPGSFAVQLMDEIHQLDLNEIDQKAKIEWVNIV